MKRGPQLVQLTNGYRKRRSAGSNSSRRQSSHVAASGVTGAAARAAAARGRRSRSPRSPVAASVAGVHALDARERRRLGGQAAHERGDDVRLALDLDEHAALVVADQPGDAELVREPVHVGPEADALDRPLDPQRLRARHSPIRSRRTCQAVAWASWMRGMCSERTTTTWSASPSAAMRPPS